MGIVVGGSICRGPASWEFKRTLCVSTVIEGTAWHAWASIKRDDLSCCCLVAKLRLSLCDPTDCSPPGSSAAAAAKSLQSFPTLCEPRDGSPPGSLVPGILQARTLEWVAIALSNACKWKAKVKSLSRIRLLATPWSAAHQAPPSMGFSRQEYWLLCQLLKGGPRGRTKGCGFKSLVLRF